MIYIKRYCKNVDITDVKFIEKCCFKYLSNKWGRDDVARLFVEFSNYSSAEVKSMIKNKNKQALFPIVTIIAEYLSGSFSNRDLKLKQIKYFKKIDGMSKKERIIGVQEPLHQICDYIAVEGLLTMFNAKIGVFQCASLPQRGQIYGKRYIEKWVKESKNTYFVKGDIRKCFPSIPHDKLKKMLLKDVKNETLLWLVFHLIDMFQDGLSIGSYLSQYLSNYYLSYAYHYASEQLFRIRKTKRNGNIRVRLINHVLFYMDDFLMIGSCKKDLKKAMRMLVKYINEVLGLEAKPWKICKISDREPIDMMGFVFRKNKTTIRAKIFLKTRKYFLKVKKLLKLGIMIPELLAYQCVSAYGWYKNTDSYTIRDKLGIDKIHIICKERIGYYSKLERSDVDYANI